MLSIRATMIIHERDEIISALTNLSTHVQILILSDKVTATSVNLQVTCSDMIFVDVPECYIHNLQNAQISHISICDFIQAFAVTAAFEFPVVPLVSCSPSILTLLCPGLGFLVSINFDCFPLRRPSLKLHKEISLLLSLVFAKFPLTYISQPTCKMTNNKTFDCVKIWNTIYLS